MDVENAGFLGLIHVLCLEMFLVDFGNNKSDFHHHHQIVPTAQILLTLSLSNHPYWSSLLVGHLYCIQYSHWADVCKSL